MNLLKYELQKEMEKMQDVLAACKKIINKAPAGRIRVSKCKNSYQYYFCKEDEKNIKGRYVKKSEWKLVQKIIEKEYVENLQNVCKRRFDELERLERILIETEPQEVFNALSQGKQKMLKPLVVSDEEYGREWEKVLYQGKSFPENYPEIYSERGERVRSKQRKLLRISCIKKGYRTDTKNLYFWKGLVWFIRISNY